VWNVRSEPYKRKAPPKLLFGLQYFDSLERRGFDGSARLVNYAGLDVSVKETSVCIVDEAARFAAR
jgi:hypothetical protein